MTKPIARIVNTLKDKGAMKSIDIANVLGTYPDKIHHWTQGKSFPSVGAENLLLDLEYVIDQLSDYYGPREARVWLYGCQYLLQGERPIDLIRKRKAGLVILALDHASGQCL